jgi:hypothetical protein
MFALIIQAGVMLAIIGSYVHSRRVTEGSVLNAAATSLVYGLVEQIKGLDYSTMLPSSEPDLDYDPANKAPNIAHVAPYYTVRVRINQDLTVFLRTVYDGKFPGHPKATKGPASNKVILVTAKADDVGAVDNDIGNLPLSTVTGTTSQTLGLNIWLWIDNIPDNDNDIANMKKVTMVYTYQYMDGISVRTVRDREVFLRTQYDQ